MLAHRLPLDKVSGEEFALANPGLKVKTTSTGITTVVHGYNPTSEKALRIKAHLEGPGKGKTMESCAKDLDIPYNTFRRMVKDLYPTLWIIDPGAARRLKTDSAEIQQEMEWVKEALAENVYKTEALNKCMTKYGMKHKRFYALIKHIEKGAEAN